MRTVFLVAIAVIILGIGMQGAYAEKISDSYECGATSHILESSCGMSAPESCHEMKYLVNGKTLTAASISLGWRETYRECDAIFDGTVELNVTGAPYVDFNMLKFPSELCSADVVGDPDLVFLDGMYTWAWNVHQYDQKYICNVNGTIFFTGKDTTYHQVRPEAVQSRLNYVPPMDCKNESITRSLIKTDPYGSQDPLNRTALQDNCYLQKAHLENASVDLCDNMLDPDTRSTCMGQYIERTGDTSICNRSWPNQHTQDGYNRDYYYNCVYQPPIVHTPSGDNYSVHTVVHGSIDGWSPRGDSNRLASNGTFMLTITYRTNPADYYFWSDEQTTFYFYTNESAPVSVVLRFNNTDYVLKIITSMREERDNTNNTHADRFVIEGFATANESDEIWPYMTIVFFNEHTDGQKYGVLPRTLDANEFTAATVYLEQTTYTPISDGGESYPIYTDVHGRA